MARLAVGCLVAIVFSLAVLIAVTVPYHDFDALAYGEWSRLIADHGHLRFPSITDQTYHRPLFYVLQGAVWWLFGFSEESGRLLSLAFSAVLVVSIACLVRRSGRFGPASLLAVLFLFLLPDFFRWIAAGQTDLPLAGLICLCAVFLWRTNPPPLRNAFLIAAVSLSAVLMKPTALLALAALGAAHLLGDRAGLRGRVVYGVIPIAAGAFVALIYDFVQARYVGRDLYRFLNAGVTEGYYSDLANQTRGDSILGVQWLGVELRLVLAFALAYAVLRIAKVSHRRSVFVALPLAGLVSIAGPFVAGSDLAATTIVGSSEALVAFVVTACVLAASAWAPASEVPMRLELARMLVWAVPPLVVWLEYVPFDTRLLSPAWPGLLALLALVSAPAFAVLLTRVPVVALAALAVAFLGVANNAYNLDGLGKSGWNEYRRLGADVTDEDRTRAIVLPAFADAKRLVDAEIGDKGRVFSPEGRFRYYYPGRANQYYPSKCADLAGYQAFVLLTDDGTKDYMERTFKVSAEPTYWAACTSPRLTQLSDGASGYAVFRVSAGGA